MKFKAGDKVRIVNSYYSGEELAVGQTGTVVEVTHYYEVAMDNGYTASNPNDTTWPFSESELEKVE